MKLLHFTIDVTLYPNTYILKHNRTPGLEHRLTLTQPTSPPPLGYGVEHHAKTNNKKVKKSQL